MKQDKAPEWWYPAEDQKLSTAILEAIQDETGEDITEADFTLYNDIDPQALDRLFREDSTANTTVQFETDAVTVRLKGDGAVAIQILPHDDGQEKCDCE